MSYYSEVLADSPNAYFRLGESSGTAAVDVKGGASGTYTGGFSLAQSGALANDADTSTDFNGSTGYVNVADRAEFDLGDVFTLEAWIRMDAGSADQVFIDKSQLGYNLKVNTSNQLELRQGDVGSIVTSTLTLSVGRWYHVVATKNGATVKLYIDARDVTGAVTNRTCVNNIHPFAIGSAYYLGAPQQFFNGRVDEVAIYPTALSQDRIAAHYLASGHIIQGAAGGNAGNPTTAPTCTLGTTAAGDILIFGLVDGNTNTGPASLTGTSVTTGGLTWTKKIGAAGNGTTMHGSLWWARATGDHSGQTIIAATNNSGASCWASYRGCVETGDPFEAAVATGIVPATTSVSGFTTTTPGVKLLQVLAIDDDVFSSTETIGGITSHRTTNGQSTGGNDTGVEFNELNQEVPGATGNFVWTGNTADWKVALIGSLKPRAETGVQTVTFTPTSELLNSIGSALNGLTGAYTLAWLGRPIGTEGGLIGMENATDNLAIYLDTGIPSLASPDDLSFKGDFASLPSGEKVLVAVTRPAGANQTPTFHIYRFSNASWSHVAGDTVIDNMALTMTHVIFGQVFGTPGFSGDISVAGMWNVALTNSHLAELVANSRTQDWMSCTGGAPLGLWDAGSSSLGTDLTGAGANESSRSGTFITNDGPANWVYGVASASAISMAMII